MISLGNFYKLSVVLSSVAAKEERGFSYDLYWKDENRPATPDDMILVGEPIQVTDDDEEIYPALARENGLWIYCNNELIQDVVDLAVKQKPSATPDELVKCLEHYIAKDNFLDLN